MQDVRAWGWRTTIKSVARDIGQHYGVVGVPFILLLSSSPLNNQKYPPTSGAKSPRWAGILRFRSIRVNLFGLWLSLNPRFGSTTGWCRTSLLLQCHPIAGQRRYPLKVLYTVDVALQGKNAIHDNMLNRKSILLGNAIYRKRYFLRQCRYFLQKYSEFPHSTGYACSLNIVRRTYPNNIILIMIIQIILFS